MKKNKLVSYWDRQDELEIIWTVIHIPAAWFTG